MMKATTITPNLIQLTKFGLMNAYLVREDDGFTLVDTTMSAADDLIAAATAAGGEIKRIVLTHGHSDHVGSVDGLAAKLGPGVPVMISDIDARILAGESVDFGPTGTKRGGWPKLTTALDTSLTPGGRVESLEVVAAPGHTPGQWAFLDTRDQSLIVGDAFSSIGGVAVPSRFKAAFPLPYLATCDRPTALSTAKSLRALNPSVLAVGHGRATENPGSAMDQAIAAGQSK
jgi:glyoxylase-like metal-dependent hydrolase (beta-lactamase superfamily II)